MAEKNTPSLFNEAIVNTYYFLRIGGAASGAYHGYKRSRGSVASAIGWSILGTIFPLTTTGISVAQGYGKAKKKGT
jgi:hypothetical protein